MALPNLSTTLKRGVGRRIFTFFLLAGLLPVAFTASLAYFEINRGIEQETNSTLRVAAINYGQNLQSRTQLVSSAANDAARVFSRSGISGLQEQDFLLATFDRVSFESAAGESRSVFTSNEASSASAAGTETLALSRTAQHGSAVSGRLLFQINASRIWDVTANPTNRTSYCVFSASGEMRHCSQEMGAGIHDFMIGHANHGGNTPGEWQQNGDTYLGAVAQADLGSDFNLQSVDIIAIQAASAALRSQADFSRVFLPALVLVVLLVGALSFAAIRESLTPLQRLTTAVQQITAGNLEARLRIRSNDEFEWLGRAFNQMATKLGQQISTFKAMSEIDRQILSGAKFEQVSESVVKHLIEITGYNSAAVIARDEDTQDWAKMICAHADDIVHERIALPKEMGHHWCQPRQVSLDETDDTIAPYRARFQGFGVKFVALIPVVLRDELKGILLLGSTSRLNLEQESLLRCIDLAGRFAVALASVEREEALYRRAHFDELTGLPNRQLLKDRLSQQIIHARRDKFSGALLFLDLDRFKEINDAYGHSVGDIVLTQAAQRIRSEVRDSDTVARLGGDEFVVVLPRINDVDFVHVTASRLLDRLTESFSVRGAEHFVGGSIGIVTFPNDGDSVETLLKNADTAMYRAKEAGRARFEFFSKKLNADSRRKIGLERDLRAAFHNDKLHVFLQPQFDIATGAISGAEALLRWRREDEGFVSPSEFVPLAEESGLIVEIGDWVIEQTCIELRRILDKGLHPGPVSINVSARQLRAPSFAGGLLTTLRKFDIHPGYLSLEITESVVAQNRDTAIEILNTLRAEGVRVAIDDFGTGYSSLSYLQQMPFDVIKIDKSFVDRIGAGDPSDNICRTIIKMAHELGKKAIAEGVEYEMQLGFLKENGCDYAQGYFYSEALHQDEFLAFVEKQDNHTQRRKALEIV